MKALFVTWAGGGNLPPTRLGARIRERDGAATAVDALESLLEGAVR